MATLHDTRLKFDFQYYCENRLHIPFEDAKFIITESHLRGIRTVQDNPFSVVKGYRGWGKCLDQDTFLQTPNGKVRIKDINIGDELFSMNDDLKIVKNTVKEKEFTGIKKAYRITLMNGMELISSEDHRVNTFNGFKAVKDLSIKNDHLIIANKKTLSKIAKIDQNNAFQKYLNSEISYVKIKSIEYIGVRIMYDIEMENEKNFFANGINVHNSKLFTFCYTMWRAEMWNESAVILSANEDLAYQKLDDIRSSCEFDNEQLAYMSGKGVDGITWNRGEIWLIDRKHYITGDDGKPIFKIKAKIYAKGIFSNFRGIHVHNILGDDIVVEDNSQTPDQREQLKKRFFAAALGMRLSRNKTHVVVIGTPQNPEDLLEELCSEKNTMWAKFIQPVLDEHGLASCPELHDMMWINEQKKLVGDVIFQQEYMLKPMSVGQDFFGEMLLDSSKNYEMNMEMEYHKTPNEFIVIGTDFAVKDDKREAEQKDTDYFALSVISYNRKTGKRKIINLYRDRGVKKVTQLNTVRIFDLKYQADKIAMEGFVFLDWAKQDLSEDLGHKIVDTSTFKGKQDIKDGIPSLQFEFEKGQYIVPYGDDYSKTMANIFFSELKNFQTTKHDDVADAVLRAERAIRNEEGVSMGYQKDFALYGQDRLTRSQIPKGDSWLPKGY